MTSEALPATVARPGEPRAALARPALACTALARTGAPDFRRCLQLALAGLWLLDALLQFQAVMFAADFARMIGAAAAGNPAFVAGPVGWTAHLIAARPLLANGAFATLQLLIGLGIAWRPARRVALAASVAWALGVWWLGEGLGGLLSGATSPVGRPARSGPALRGGGSPAVAAPAGHRRRVPGGGSVSALRRLGPPRSSCGARWRRRRRCGRGRWAGMCPPRRPGSRAGWPGPISGSLACCSTDGQRPSRWRWCSRWWRPACAGRPRWRASRSCSRSRLAQRSGWLRAWAASWPAGPPTRVPGRCSCCWPCVTGRGGPGRNRRPRSIRCGLVRRRQRLGGQRDRPGLGWLPAGWRHGGDGRLLPGPDRDLGAGRPPGRPAARRDACADGADHGRDAGAVVRAALARRPAGRLRRGRGAVRLARDPLPARASAPARAAVRRHGLHARQPAGSAAGDGRAWHGRARPGARAARRGGLVGRPG